MRVLFCGFECYTYFYLEIGIRISFGENLYSHFILVLIFENDRLFILHCFFPLFVFIFAHFGALSEGGGFGII